MCLSIGTPFVPNGKLNIFRCPKIWAHYSLIVMCLNIGTPNYHHFPFGINEKVVMLCVPIRRHFRVVLSCMRLAGMRHRCSFSSIDGIHRVFLVQLFSDNAQSCEAPSSLEFFFVSQIKYYIQSNVLMWSPLLKDHLS